LKTSIWILILTATTTSCQRGDRVAARDEKAEDALVALLLDVERLEDHRPSRIGIGFFVSARATVLTAAHMVPTTHPVVLVYKSGAATSCGVAATVVKRDTRLDLALLQPVQPLSPPKFLRLDLQKTPARGQPVVILTLLTVRPRELNEESYYAAAAFPGTVVAVLREGRLLTDVPAYSGISGSPIVDPSSGNVVGIGMKRFDLFYDEELTLARANGTTVSLAVPPISYAIGRCLNWARDFLAGVGDVDSGTTRQGM